ncbi:Glutamine synthetase leaf isozyme [Hibiscus syriacus]|uniref:Glutamine synthetase n=2 Tax=Pentapetalae TaxID=1437201 RepID=A0A6A3BD86_HIBSY|nr:Glutamine synthetase leaf isozyme [Hibiscus syriacus]
MAVGLNGYWNVEEARRLDWLRVVKPYLPSIWTVEWVQIEWSMLVRRWDVDTLRLGFAIGLLTFDDGSSTGKLDLTGGSGLMAVGLNGYWNVEEAQRLDWLRVVKPYLPSIWTVEWVQIEWSMLVRRWDVDTLRLGFAIGLLSDGVSYGRELESWEEQFLVMCQEWCGGEMAQILAPSTQWQMRLPKTSTFGSPIATKMWSPLMLKQNRKGAAKSSGKFRVLALSENSTVNRLEKFLNMDITPYTDKIIAEYIWIGGSGIDMRSKSRTISKPVEHPSELPKWNYDGSSTGQAPGDDSEVILYPQAIFKDPFRGGNNILVGTHQSCVLCDAYTPAGEPIPTNKRARAAEIFSSKKVVDEVPWFGIEQEYTLLQQNVKWPLGWPVGGYPGPQGPYYCAAGADKSFGRDISDAHYKACLYAGINISGTNGEVMPGQWEYQVGPSVGIEAGDHIWCSRYLLERITEQAGVVLSLDPKPIEGDWNGAGCHTNYSTKSMREEGGFDVIKKAILNLSLRHKEHISAYGEGNERRLTGKHETASIDTFSWGVANRGCSIRVGRDTEKNGKGYLEDRRPASNMDPYVVTSLLAETTLLYEPTLEAEALAAQKIALKV